MKCPTCPDAMLMMSDRQGVEVDYCPRCRGVWLDRGEIDKLIERSARPAGRGTDRAFGTSYESDDDRHRVGRKRSWLHEILD